MAAVITHMDVAELLDKLYRQRCTSGVTHTHTHTHGVNSPQPVNVSEDTPIVPSHPVRVPTRIRSEARGPLKVKCLGKKEMLRRCEVAQKIAEVEERGREVAEGLLKEIRKEMKAKEEVEMEKLFVNEEVEMRMVAEARLIVLEEKVVAERNAAKEERDGLEAKLGHYLEELECLRTHVGKERAALILALSNSLNDLECLNIASNKEKAALI